MFLSSLLPGISPQSLGQMLTMQFHILLDPEGPPWEDHNEH